jgi:exopolyphosphatase/guanosine-5'-triphosphate,3'-diphosphate pyrophosphatase
MPIHYKAELALEGAMDRVGIIDIGSNSVRMVVYHGTKRIPLPLFNEKYMCALGKGIVKTGKLNPKGVIEARSAMARFILMARRMEVQSLDILATAAVRDASDGAEFVRSIEREHGVKIQVISGERESELAAKGILTSVHEPLGMSADLGGGSMEVAQIERTRVGKAASLHLGSLRVLEESDGKPAQMEKIITQQLANVSWLKDAHPHMIYAIGGGFRTLAKLHMKKTDYPLPIVHEYQLSRRSIDHLCDRLCAMKPEEIAELPGISNKRAPLMIPTALALKHLMHHTASPMVMFSVSGVREGFFYDMLESRVQGEDGLIASATDLAALVGLTGAYARELYQWMQPLFTGEPLPWQRLRRALCILSELAWSIDPNFRASWAYHRIIQSSLKGVDHKERIMLALALYHRYQLKWKKTRPEHALVDERERLWAKVVGAAANLAYDLTGGKAGTLYHAKLSIVEGSVTLTLDHEASPLRTEIVEKRLLGLGEAFKAFSRFLL